MVTLNPCWTLGWMVTVPLGGGQFQKPGLPTPQCVQRHLLSRRQAFVEKRVDPEQRAIPATASGWSGTSASASFAVLIAASYACSAR